MKFCEIQPKKICDDCGDCDICDLDHEKICDNCGKCIETDQDYAEIKIERIILDEDESEANN